MPSAMRGGEILLYRLTMIARNTDLIPKQSQPPREYFRISATFDILGVRANHSNSSVLFQFYKAKSGTKSKHGRTPNEEKSKKEEDAEMADTPESFARELTRAIHMAESLPIRPDGAVSYTASYRKSSTGYKGRLITDGVSMAQSPMRVRAVAYRDLGLRDWDVSMAYFAFSAHAVYKLEIKRDIPYFRLETVKKYTVDMDFPHKFTRGGKTDY